MSNEIIGWIIFIIGFIVGWLIRGIVSGKEKRKLDDQIDIMRIANKKQTEEKDAIINGFIEKAKEEDAKDKD